MDTRHLIDLLPAPMRRRVEPTLEMLGVVAASDNRRVMAGMLPSALRGMVLRKAKVGGTTLSPCQHNAYFDWRYESDFKEMGDLYRKAKSAQWNGDDLPWSTPLDPFQEGMSLFPDEYLPVTDLPVWGKMSAAERQRLRRDMAAWTLSQFLHGEQGALFAAAQVTESVRWMDAKFYGATQVMDEARHVEVFRRYLLEKIGKLYPINDNLFVILDALTTDPRWDMKFLGMQIMVEGLALGAFGMIYRLSSEPLLKELLRYVIQDEARHVLFGVLALRKYIREELTEAARREREDWAFEVSVLMRNRFLFHEIYEESFAHAMSRSEWNRSMLESKALEEFRLSLFSRLVPNLRYIGLLSDRIAPHYEKMGLLRYREYRDATGLTADDLLRAPDEQVVSEAG